MRKLASRKNAFLKLLLPVLALSLSGCVYLVVGGLGALGGYVVSPDTVEGLTSRDQDEVWDAATEIVSIMGLIQEEQEASGMIISVINDTKVTITVMAASPSTVKVTVKARKAGLFPRIALAQDVYIKIMSRLSE